MRKQSQRIGALILVAILIIVFAVPVMATDNENSISPRSSAYITAVWASASGGTGSITVDFSITGTGRMSSLGATTVSIRDSSGTTIKTFHYTTTDGMMGSNQGYYSSSVTWYGATSGSKYYAVVYFKASNSSGYDTTSYTTGYAYAK